MHGRRLLVMTAHKFEKTPQALSYQIHSHLSHFCFCSLVFALFWCPLYWCFLLLYVCFLCFITLPLFVAFFGHLFILPLFSSSFVCVISFYVLLYFHHFAVVLPMLWVAFSFCHCFLFSLCVLFHFSSLLCSRWTPWFCVCFWLHFHFIVVYS